jgi:hypothetical protein
VLAGRGDVNGGIPLTSPWESGGNLQASYKGAVACSGRDGSLLSRFPACGRPTFLPGDDGQGCRIGAATSTAMGTLDLVGNNGTVNPYMAGSVTGGLTPMDSTVRCSDRIRRALPDAFEPPSLWAT